MSQTVVIAVVLGVVGGLLWVVPAFHSSRANTDEALGGIDVRQIEGLAHRNTARSFDDHYQRHMGVLDVLREYPAP